MAPMGCASRSWAAAVLLLGAADGRGDEGGLLRTPWIAPALAAPERDGAGLPIPAVTEPVAAAPVVEAPARVPPAPRETRPPRERPAARAEALFRISQVAAASAIASYSWMNRGRAPAGYIKGMAVSYARVYCDLGRGGPAALEMAKATTDDPSRDALKHYEEIFRQAAMDNTRNGADTLRHLFTLLLGLGMRESSGRHCEGRDRSANNTNSETAEAGLFQTSFNARRANPLLPRLFADFRANPAPGYLDFFQEGVRCSEANLENCGEGDGRDFQKLSKECPFFAVQFAAIGLRNLRMHWGPINRREAEVRPEADALFKQVQDMVDREKLAPLLN